MAILNAECSAACTGFGQLIRATFAFVVQLFLARRFVLKHIANITICNIQILFLYVCHVVFSSTELSKNSTWNCGGHWLIPIGSAELLGYHKKIDSKHFLIG
jgi:hypothetical protein